MTENTQGPKAKTYYLYWIHPKSQKRIMAGVAFYDETYCEFRLKIDDLKNRKLYLKPVKSEDEAIVYRVDEVLEIKGKKIRRTQGYGSRSEATNGHVHFEVTPFLNTQLELVV